MHRHHPIFDRRVIGKGILALMAVTLAAMMSTSAASRAVIIPTHLPFPYYRRFTIRISGIDKTDWRAPRFYYLKNTYGLYWREAHGTERIWFNSGLVHGFAFAVSQREFPTFEFGSFQLDRNASPALPAVGGVDRDGETSRGADPGPAGGGRPTITTGPYDCRYIRRDYDLWIEPKSNRTFALTAVPIGAAAHGVVGYKNCPASGGGPTVPGIFWPIRARLPIAAMFAGKKLQIHAHRVFRTRPTGASNLTATTDVSWVLTLTPES